MQEALRAGDVSEDATPTKKASQLPSDEDMLRRLRKRDEAAFTMLLDAWTPGMLRVTRSLVSTDASAMEVVQDTWLAVVRGIDGFQGRSALRTWVYRILVNTAKRRGQQEARIVPWEATTDDLETPTVDPARFQGATGPYPGHWREFPSPWPTPEDAALSGEVREVVTAAVSRLPIRQRTVITLRDVDGCTSEEVCEILDITLGHQRVLLHRARASVRAALEAYYEATTT
jgi:RNA polymerase sigma-70 factor, ECF subfamily